MAAQVESEGFVTYIMSIPNKVWNNVSELDWASYPIVDIGMFVGLGFFGGFLFRRYFQYLVIGGILLSVVFIGLDTIDVIHIDWHHIRELTGINADMSIAELARQLVASIQERMLAFMSFVVGFLVGFALM